MRKVDRLGRIVIPLELREKYGLMEGAPIEFIDAGEGVTVKTLNAFCKVCRARVELGITFPLCKACYEKLNRIIKITVK